LFNFFLVVPWDAPCRLQPSWGGHGPPLGFTRYIYIYMLCICIYLYMCVYIYIYVCICGVLLTLFHLHVHIYVFTWLFIYLYTSMYTYIQYPSICALRLTFDFPLFRSSVRCAAPVATVVRRSRPSSRVSSPTRRWPRRRRRRRRRRRLRRTWWIYIYI